MASSSPGKAKTSSVERDSTESSQPPRQAAATPTATPARVEKTTTPSGPSREVRAPVTRREKVSRPEASTPSRWSAEGPASALERSTELGSCGASQGASSARRTTSATNPRQSA